MNHQFQPSIGLGFKCSICKLGALEHSPNYPCDSCGLEVGNDSQILTNSGKSLVLCIACDAREQLAYSESTRLNTLTGAEGTRTRNDNYSAETRSPNDSYSPNANSADNNHADELANEPLSISKKITNQARKLINESLITGRIQSYEEFFNASIVSFEELHDKIVADDSIGTDYEKECFFAECMQKRFFHLKSVLFKTKELELEIVSQMKAVQQSLNQQANNLRAEEQAKLKLTNINYTVQTAPIKIPRVKQSPVDKMAAGLATIMKLETYYEVIASGESLFKSNDKLESELYSKQHGGMVFERTAIEQAKKIIQNKLKSAD